MSRVRCPTDRGAVPLAFPILTPAVTAENEWRAEATLSADIGASNVRAGVAQGGHLVYLVEQQILTCWLLTAGTWSSPWATSWSRCKRPWARTAVRSGQPGRPHRCRCARHRARGRLTLGQPELGPPGRLHSATAWPNALPPTSSSTTTPAWLLWASCFTVPGPAKAGTRCSLWAPTLAWASWSMAGF